MYDLLVKGGEVIDPAQDIHDQRDIGISQGKIAALASEIAPSDARKVINAEGKIVTPGLIDLHVHVADGIHPLGAVPDEVGVLSGVTTLCDAGSTGYANFSGLKRYVIPQAQTDVLCFLQVAPTGDAFVPEICDWHNINPEATLQTIEENRDIIRGVKLRANGTLVEKLGIEAVRVAKGIATKVGLPLMVHIGIDDGELTPDDVMTAYTRNLLSLLDSGDIITHCYTPRAGGVIQRDGSVLPELREAMERGVLLDVANARANFTFELARIGLEQGILPHTLSTDITCVSRNARSVLSLLVTMSKFLALGLSLDQVIAMTTINPAMALGEERSRGSLRIGVPADVSILELSEGNFLFFDSIAEDTSLAGKYLLVPNLVLKSGVEIVAHSHFR